MLSHFVANLINIQTQTLFICLNLNLQYIWGKRSLGMPCSSKGKVMVLQWWLSGWLGKGERLVSGGLDLLSYWANIDVGYEQTNVFLLS